MTPAALKVASQEPQSLQSSERIESEISEIALQDSTTPRKATRPSVTVEVAPQDSDSSSRSLVRKEPAAFDLFAPDTLPSVTYTNETLGCFCGFRLMRGSVIIGLFHVIAYFFVFCLSAVFIYQTEEWKPLFDWVKVANLIASVPFCASSVRLLIGISKRRFWYLKPFLNTCFLSSMLACLTVLFTDFAKVEFEVFSGYFALAVVFFLFEMWCSSVVRRCYHSFIVMDPEYSFIARFTSPSRNSPSEGASSGV